MDKVKATFNLAFWHQTQKKWVSVEKEGFIIETEFGKILANEDKQGRWNISEYSTGTRIPIQPLILIDNAIDAAIHKIKEVGVEVYKQRILEQVESTGVFNK